MDTDRIELTAAIANLRTQLQEAIKAGEGEELRFAVQDIEIEFKCIAKTEDAGKIGVKFYVIKGEAGLTVGSEKVQTVKLKLKPVGDVLLSAEDEVR